MYIIFFKKKKKKKKKKVLFTGYPLISNFFAILFSSSAFNSAIIILSLSFS